MYKDINKFNEANSEYGVYENSFSSFLSKVFLLMFLGLGITAAVAVGISYNENTVYMIARGLGRGTLLFFAAHIIIAVSISKSISSLNTGVAMVLFIVYSVMNGLMFSVLGLIYEVHSILWAFVSAGIFFGLLAVYGIVTKRDLTSMGRFLFIGLISIIVCSIVNLFIKSPAFNYYLSILGIVVFAGYTMYDINRLKNIYTNSIYDGKSESALAIFGAFQLYLDFINIFLRLLSIMGKRRK